MMNELSDVRNLILHLDIITPLKKYHSVTVHLSERDVAQMKLKIRNQIEYCTRGVPILVMWVNQTGTSNAGIQDGFELVMPAALVARSLFEFTVVTE